MSPPAWIARLVRERSISRASVGRESEWALGQLIALGLVSEEVRGNRRRVVVRDSVALEQWTVAAYPLPVETPLPGVRAGNIARSRRSKAGTSTHTVQPLLLRWFDPHPESALTNVTQRFGLVGITTDHIAALQPTPPWTLLTVENWESFLGTQYERCEETVVVIYTGGNIADTTVQALATIAPPPQHTLHFGDYDWTGLAIYRRLHAAIPALQLYVPEEITALFAQFANTSLLVGQVPLVAHVNDSPAVRQVIALIAQYNAGLEQEIVPPPRFPLLPALRNS